MKVLDAGTETLSNADVLNWIKEKRKQIAEEDKADKKSGKKPSHRPANFLSALTKHERELDSGKYPFHKNPEVYGNYNGLNEFEEKVMETIVKPFTETRMRELKEQGVSDQEIEITLEKEQEAKLLTETEQLMVYNHAPQCVEMLQPMVENIEDRLTAEEQEAMVQVIMEVYRKQEASAGSAEAGAEAAG
ncbi:hypothetical protein D0869_12627 [Hortaea werneckii]|uniref:DNA-directed RNA polymerase III subunit RPC9 n=1 Tax=Hortaea werneckii TaxID=91943 RepID=A0A3M6W7F7_HORWE|nr:hypothetical protein KC324_g19162 [Hortaea werneckii]KAI7522938.1 hypothetical protein KC316_g19100 [Hortaea werneckii]RMX74408.1 hypothetical protein D0869_12627 [Hortaea werneckii]RMX94053.1 hypothetical protein D0868_12508 [Hortaea werneckii]